MIHVLSFQKETVTHQALGKKPRQDTSEERKSKIDRISANLQSSPDLTQSQTRLR